MTKNYAPGPYLVQNHNIYNVNVEVIAMTCQLPTEALNQKQPMRKATAVLLAAAPELVEALIGMAKKAAWDHAKDYNSGDNKWAEVLPSGPECDDPDQYAEDHWEDFLTKDARAALTKAGVSTKD